jgi:predicted metal-binding protein
MIDSQKLIIQGNMGIKIGILHCLEATKVCAGCGCLNAFNLKKGSFKEYAKEDVLAAYFTCNGCKIQNEAFPKEDMGMIEKVDRLQSEGIDVVHVGVCCEKADGSLCGRIEEIIGMIKRKGIQIKNRTHS